MISRILHPSFGGQNFCLVVGCISAYEKDLRSTLATLNWLRAKAWTWNLPVRLDLRSTISGQAAELEMGSRLRRLLRELGGLIPTSGQSGVAPDLFYPYLEEPPYLAPEVVTKKLKGSKKVISGLLEENQRL